MQRVSVVGCSGSGKSTTARRLAQCLDVPYVELDAIHWGPNWTPAPPEQKRERVAQAIEADAWVTDGNYFGSLGGLIWDRADTVVWVNPPRWKVMWRSISRTARRVATREELWSGNRETWRTLLLWWRDDSIVHWAWTSYARVEERLSTAMADPGSDHLTFHRLTFHRLTTSRQVEDFLTAVAPGPASCGGRRP